jgi:uncharacterized tellurite resistance protein B-like protein
MRLRSLLTTIGLQPDGPAPDADPFVRRLQNALRRLGPNRLEYLAGFAGQLARVANADAGISAAEASVIAGQLVEHAKLTPPEAKVVVDLLRREFEVLRSVQHHILNRAINNHASPGEKETLVESLYAVAAADHLVSDVEDREIRCVADALLLPRSVQLAIRGRYRDRLEVVQLMKRGRTA